MKLRVVFMGSPAFSVPTLKALANSFKVVGVVTQPDKPTGRGRKVTSNPVKIEANNLDIPCIQPTDLTEDCLRGQLEKWSPDVIVVVAYGKILPKWILDFPDLGCINVHASILPQYRGASPISAAIMRGDRTTGVTTMMMGQGLDTGDILLQASVEINDRETSGSLSEKLMELGAELVVKTILKVCDKTLKSVSQDNSKATETSLLSKNDGKINWNQSAAEIDRQIRAMNPWPIAFFTLNGESIKVWEAEPRAGNEVAGKVISIGKDGVVVGAKTDLIVLKQLQAPGKKKVAAFELASSKGIKLGDILNN